MSERDSEKFPFSESQMNVMLNAPDSSIAIGLLTSLNKGLTFEEAVQENRENPGADELYKERFKETVNHFRVNSDKLGIKIEKDKE
jgi:hypothetical protein